MSKPNIPKILPQMFVVGTLKKDLKTIEETVQKVLTLNSEETRIFLIGVSQLMDVLWTNLRKECPEYVNDERIDEFETKLKMKDGESNEDIR